MTCDESPNDSAGEQGLRKESTPMYAPMILVMAAKSKQGWYGRFSVGCRQGLPSGSPSSIPEVFLSRSLDLV